MRRPIALLLIGALALACAAADVTPSVQTTPAVTDGYAEDLDPALQTRLTPADAAAIAFRFLAASAGGEWPADIPSAPPARIVKVSVRPASDVQSVEINGPNSPGDDRAIWIVRAEGAFSTSRPRPAYWPTGFLLIDDATGDIVGDGMP